MANQAVSVLALLLSLLCFESISLVRSAYWTQGNNAILSVDLNNINSYSISIQNETWLLGTEPNLWCNNHWYSTMNNMYLLKSETTSPIQTKGTDKNLGDWVGLQMKYTLTSNDNICNDKTMIILFQYFDTDDFFLFTQRFPNGLFNTNIKQYMNPPSNGLYTPMIPLSEFPAFSYSLSSMLRNKLGYIEWQGRFMHDRSNHGIGLTSFEGGNEGGPIVLFKDGIKPTSSLIFSTASNFMNGIFAIRTRRADNNNKNCTFVENTDFEANDIQLIPNINSAEDCCSLCNINEYCNVFTYIPNESGYSKNCYLKYNDRGKTAHSGHESGYIGNDNNNNGNLDYLVAGIEGNITLLPMNYSISFIVSALKNKGIHGGMYKWGNILQKKYETKKLDPSIDLTVSTLGYWTDNGGYFYGGNPLTTDIATKLFDAFRSNEIPVRYLQLDPFWYMGGSNNNNGIVWVPRSDLFPNGLTDLYNKINKVPLLLYSSYWSPNKTQNYYNSKYNMSLQFANSLGFNVGWLKGPISEPLGYESSYNFYKLIINEYADIMMGFEVDFMDFEYEDFTQLTSGYNGMINGSQQWTKGMQDACMEHQFSVQYCMSLPAYILQSLQYPAVTNARASEDDFPGNHNRWQIGYTALLLSPLGISAFMDVIWTTSVQPGNKYNSNTMDCEMQVIIACLSTGPVGIGDNINMTNKTIINRFVRKDGIILKPSNAITPIDAMYSSVSSFKPSGEVWMTYSFIMNNIQSYHVLAIDVSSIKYKLSFSDLYPMPNINDNFYYYLFDDANHDNVNGQCMNNTNIQQCGLMIFNNSQTLNIETQPPPKNNPSHLHSWNLYNFCKIQNNGWTLLGEMNKYSNISPQRFKSITINANGLTVVVKGAPNEIVVISFVTNKLEILQIKVTFNSNGDDQTVVV